MSKFIRFSALHVWIYAERKCTVYIPGHSPSSSHWGEWFKYVLHILTDFQILGMWSTMIHHPVKITVDWTLHGFSRCQKPFMMQFQVGDRVRLSNTLYPEINVASETVMALWGAGVFHGKPIPPQYLRVTLEKVSLNQPLMVPVEQVEQVTLEDAMGSSVLWARELTILEKWSIRWGSRCKGLQWTTFSGVYHLRVPGGYEERKWISRSPTCLRYS